MELNKIYNCKCETGLQIIDSNSIDLIVTSPPYDDIRDYDKFTLDLHLMGFEMFRVLKNGGMLCMVIQDTTKNFGKSCTTYRTIIDYVDNIGFKLFENVIYSRDGRPGAWWNKRFRVDHEYILMFLKGDRPKYFNKEPLKIKAKHAGKMWKGTQRFTSGELKPITSESIQSDLKCRGTIWKYESSKSERNKTKLIHPATFPDKLAEDLITCFSKENEIVLDPLAGSGTTLRMAKNLNRNYIGFEISKNYCEIAETLLVLQN